jgi:8-oxo-dGTP pyrophosphatase MutT (NUDIX family)
LHTAIRELREETGLVVTLDDVLDLQESNGDSLDLKERYLNPVKKVGKEVRYWVVLVTGEQATRELRLQTKEVNDSRWCGWDEAESLVTFEETRAMLKSVREAMERKEGKDKEGAGEREGKL